MMLLHHRMTISLPYSCSCQLLQRCMLQRRNPDNRWCSSHINNISNNINNSNNNNINNINNNSNNNNNSTSFYGLGLNKKLVRLLKNKGIYSPTEIQQKAIPALLRGDHVVMNSETGSGKTLAYALPMIDKIQRIREKGLQVPCPYGIVIVPDTALLYQVSNVFSEVLNAKVVSGVQHSGIRLKDTEVVVTTAPYLMTYDLTCFRHTQTLVVDEADEMIGRKVGKFGKKDPLFNLVKQFLDYAHFQQFDECHKMRSSGKKNPSGDDEQMYYSEEDLNFYDINSSSTTTTSLADTSETQEEAALFHTERQFVFAGATMPYSDAPRAKYALNYIKHWVQPLNVIKTKNTHTALHNIHISYQDITQDVKFEQLVESVLRWSEDSNDQKFRVLVFVDHVTTLEQIHTRMYSEDYLNVSNSFLPRLRNFQKTWNGSVHVVHGNMIPQQRSNVLSEFSSQQRSILLTTDVAARGLDFDVDAVIQYDFPKDVVKFLHRIGRTGRMGKPGKVLNFITASDVLMSTLIRDAVVSGQTLDDLFSRRRGLQRRIQRQENNILTQQQRLLMSKKVDDEKIQLSVYRENTQQLHSEDFDSEAKEESAA